jgi:hypothetical protein
MPRYDVRAHHATVVPTKPARAYATLRAIDLNRSRVIRCLFALRGLPSRFGQPQGRSAAPSYRTFLESALALGWVLLEEIPDRELVMGAVTQPWKPVVEFLGLPAPDFVAFVEPGFAKIAWSFAVEPDPKGSLVTLETRVLTTDPVARRRFRRYWLVFSPFIKLIRRLILGLLRRDLGRGAGAHAI